MTFIKVKIERKDNYFLKENIKQIQEIDNGFELLVNRTTTDINCEFSYKVLKLVTTQTPIFKDGELIGFEDKEEPKFINGVPNLDYFDRKYNSDFYNVIESLFERLKNVNQDLFEEVNILKKENQELKTN